MKRIYIFPRYGGNENSDWYQKIKSEIALKDQNIKIIPLNLPNWDNPSTEEFLNFIEKEIPENEIDNTSYFIGHSIGCQAALLYLDKLQKKNPELQLGGLMCVAGWWTIDKPWPQLLQWTNLPLNFNSIKHICNNNIVCLLSNNDPFTANTEANKKMWEVNLNAKVVIIAGAKHFNATDGLTEISNEILTFTLKLYFL